MYLYCNTIHKASINFIHGPLSNQVLLHVIMIPIPIILILLSNLKLMPKGRNDYNHES